MTIKSYMLSQKYSLFPEFLNMSSDEEQSFMESQESKHPRDITYRNWFWFHPSAYKLMHYGVSYICIGCFGTACILLFTSGYYILAMLSLAMTLLGVYDLYKKLRTPLVKGTTFYRMWFE